MMYQIEKELRFGYKENAELVLTDNGIAFPVEQLNISPYGDYYQNKASKERYTVVGSCQVNLDAIGKGVHYLLKDDSGRVWLIKAEGFASNFLRI